MKKDPKVRESNGGVLEEQEAIKGKEKRAQRMRRSGETGN